MENKEHQQQPKVSLPSVPRGFVNGTGPDGQQYLVPQFMVPALNQEFASYRKKMDLDVLQAKTGPLKVKHLPFDLIGLGSLRFPADPPLSNQEKLDLHGEVLSLQQQLGISYKDAAHRLYMTYVETINIHHENMANFKNLEMRLADVLNEVRVTFADAEAEYTAIEDDGAEAEVGATR